MKRSLLLILALLGVFTCSYAQPKKQKAPRKNKWVSLFAADLSNASYNPAVWSVDKSGVLTATEDQAIWTNKEYQNFVLDLDFKTAPGTNSGVVVYCTDKKNWIPNSIEIQIADDHSEQWSKQPATWQCGAIFGRLGATKQKVVKQPGEWNHYTITCRGKNITVELNGQTVTQMEMSRWTSGSTNPDGSAIPAWLNRPLAEMATVGYIGFQGKHAGAPIWYRNIRIKELK